MPNRVLLGVSEEIIRDRFIKLKGSRTPLSWSYLALTPKKEEKQFFTLFLKIEYAEKTILSLENLFGTVCFRMLVMFLRECKVLSGNYPKKRLTEKFFRRILIKIAIFFPEN